MPGFDELQNPIEALITKELKKYNDEDMIWIYQEVIQLIKNTEHLSRRIRSNRSYKNNLPSPNFKDIEKIGNFHEIRKHLKKELERINDLNLLEFFFIELNEKNKINYKDNFAFLKENKRLCLFTINYIKNIDVCRDNKRLKFFYFENPYLYIIYYYSFYRYQQNISDIKRIKTANIDIISKNYHNNSKNFQNEEFLEWAYSYLRDKSEDFSKAKYSPYTKEEYYSLIVSFLDYLLYFNKDKHYSLTSQLYKAWSQRKFRAADKLKTQYHLPLTKKTKKELEIISNIENKSENKVLEELIHNFYLQIACDEKGKYLY